MSQTIDLLLSIVFVFFLFSVIVSAVTEIIRSFSGRRLSRGHFMYDALMKVLNDPANGNFTQLIYDHPQVGSTRDLESDRLPSYVHPANFSKALVAAVISKGAGVVVKYNSKGIPQAVSTLSGKDDFEKYVNALDYLTGSQLKSLLVSFAQGTQTIEGLYANIEGWFNNYMDRVSGWYKRSSNKTHWIAAALVTLVFNVDAIKVIQKSYKDPELRNAMISGAVNAVSSDQNAASWGIDSNLSNQEKIRRIDSLYNSMKLSGLPVGWKTEYDHCHEQKFFKRMICRISTFFQLNWSSISMQTLFGWLLAVFCLKQGAPFWFDIMKRLVNMRQAGASPSEKKSSDQK